MPTASISLAWDGLYWTTSPPFVPELLTAATVNSTGATLTCSVGVAAGTLYWGVYASSATAPTLTELVAGTGSVGAGAFGSVAISATGATTASATGLTPDTSYIAYAYHEAYDAPGEDISGGSAYLVTSAVFTTTSSTTGEVPDSIEFYAGFDGKTVGTATDMTFGLNPLGTMMSASVSNNGASATSEIVSTPVYIAGATARSWKSIINGQASAVPTGWDYRSELNLTGYASKNVTYFSGLRHFFGFAVYLETGYELTNIASTNQTHTLFQIHTGTGDPGISPPVGWVKQDPAWNIKLRADGRVLIGTQFGAGSAGTADNWLIASDTLVAADMIGAWTTFVVDYLYAKDATGHFRVWVNASAATDTPAVEVTSRVTWDNILSLHGYYKIGIYNGSGSTLIPPNDRIAYYHSIRVADADLGGNFDTVNPGSYP